MAATGRDDLLNEILHFVHLHDMIEFVQSYNYLKDHLIYISLYQRAHMLYHKHCEVKVIEQLHSLGTSQANRS